MPTINDQINVSQRAEDAWRRINRHPSSIAFDRKGTLLADQTVRVEYSSSVTERSSDGAGRSSKRDVVIFGVRDHAIVADTDIQRGDTFWVQVSAEKRQQFRVVDVLLLPGEIQAGAEAAS